MLENISSLVHHRVKNSVEQSLHFGENNILTGPLEIKHKSSQIGTKNTI